MEDKSESYEAPFWESLLDEQSELNLRSCVKSVDKKIRRQKRETSSGLALDPRVSLS